MADSAFTKLDTHDRPVNKQAVVIGFFRGEHFDARFDAEHPKKHRTFRYPPSAGIERPAGATDYVGTRIGRMVACYYVTTKVLSRQRRRDVWVCRCDCGLYEFRCPSAWFRKGVSDDACEFCRRKSQMISGEPQEPSRKSKKTMPERLMRWVNEMRALGLADSEICDIRALNITIIGLSVEGIRAAIAGAKEKGNA